LRPLREPTNPEPPLAAPSGGVPAYVWTGPGPKDGPNEASVAAKLGAELAATPITMKRISKLIHTAKFASQPNLWSVRICPMTIPAAMKMTRQAMKQMLPFET